MYKYEYRYKFNKETLDYKVTVRSSPLKLTLYKVLACVVSSLFIFFLLLFLSTGILNIKDPKTAIIEKNWNEWCSRLELIRARYDMMDRELGYMENRDNNIYRSIFGMGKISNDVRNAGFGGVDRYSYLKVADFSGNLTATVMKSDILLKKAYIQSNSFDSIMKVSQRVEEMAVCVPSIPPVDYASVYKTSGFGMRLDPVNKRKVRLHEGVDLAPKFHQTGISVYATGNGVVSEVYSGMHGYGNYIIIDHGFGYKTKYAHLKKTCVVVGQEVKLGQKIAEMGNTGHSTGMHLHYEVIYMSKPVNPEHYYSTNIMQDDYASIVEHLRQNAD